MDTEQATPADPPTALDYLIRASDAFVATLPLCGAQVTRLEHQRAGRLTDYAYRCAERAARAAGRDPEQFGTAVAARDMADRAQVIVRAIYDTRHARFAGKAA